jgi:uncharacterized membrane protein
MAKRTKILGLPIGRKKRSMASKLAWAGGAIAAAAPSVMQAARKASGGVQQGRQLAEKANKIADQVGDVTKKVSDGNGGPLSMAKALTGKGGKKDDKRSKVKLSHLIEEHIDVAVPQTVAYNQWTQFEELGGILKADSASQDEDDQVTWRSKIGPSRREWKTEIVEQVPDERIAFKSKGGLEIEGVITFHELEDNLTRINATMEYHPRGVVENVGNWFRMQRRRVRKNLKLFKNFIELQGEETGAWRGKIDKDEKLDPGNKPESMQERDQDREDEDEKDQGQNEQRSSSRPSARSSSGRRTRSSARKSTARSTPKKSTSNGRQRQAVRKAS